MLRTSASATANDGAFRPVLTVTTRDLGKAVEVRVRDNGVGIPDEIKDKLFQPFFTTKPTGEGTGLGLSISYEIVTKQHGGTIRGRQRCRRVHRIHHMLCRVASPPASAAGSSASKGGVMTVSILVVDDEPDVADLVSPAISSRGAAGRLCPAFCALGCRKRSNVSPADIEPQLIVILSDINMPGMDGLALLREIKTRRPDLPVMMLTAYGDEERRRRAAEYGAAEFLTKPVDFDFLKERLRQLHGPSA